MNSSSINYMTQLYSVPHTEAVICQQNWHTASKSPWLSQSQRKDICQLHKQTLLIFSVLSCVPAFFSPFAQQGAWVQFMSPSHREQMIFSIWWSQLIFTEAHMWENILEFMGLREWWQEKRKKMIKSCLSETDINSIKQTTGRITNLNRALLTSALCSGTHVFDKVTGSYTHAQTHSDLVSCMSASWHEHCEQQRPSDSRLKFRAN